MNDEIKKEELFLSGLKTFNEENFFDCPFRRNHKDIFSSDRSCFPLLTIFSV